jgi:phospholipase/carboxylesterase
MLNQIHAQQPVYTAGAALDQAQAAMVMVHGRGATAESILALSASELHHPGFAYLAPQAAQNSWYPYSFLNPLEDNEPFLSSGLEKLTGLLAYLAGTGLPPERTLLLGFSQGACLAVEFAARNARRYGGLAGLSGGLIGPDGTPRNYAGSLDGTPVFLGCSDIDPHIPKERVQETADVLRRLGAGVTMRLYPGLGHTINQDEITFVNQMMAACAGP